MKIRIRVGRMYECFECGYFGKSPVTMSECPDCGEVHNFWEMR